eukprot:CAMPEP_0169109842 /NCGR_PEP_ID=MMETSP1015-20121227/26180_1 /TAXON_ID=342587 /ORGANISM="Karlodinium micrum, Strain CCMP2283" /LENGTH=247 /DNA_ID=CAMNT_0009171565 /DNA_START=46 /DNA_END=789 /DNA_ORIENTATION=-
MAGAMSYIVFLAAVVCSWSDASSQSTNVGSGANVQVSVQKSGVMRREAEASVRRSAQQADSKGGMARKEPEQSASAVQQSKGLVQSASALQSEEVASDFASLGLTESTIDPDKNYHAHRKDAFQMRVAGPSGRTVCLAETKKSNRVRAVKCSGKHGQHWYWDKNHLKNLNSDTRCLGYFINAASTKDPKESHQLAMYHCGDEDSSHTGWKVDDEGRLRSLGSDRCMAFDEGVKMNAITLPCTVAPHL